MFRSRSLAAANSLRVSTSYIQGAHASTLVHRINQVVEELPMREYARYKVQNTKLSAKDFLRYAEKHAEAMFDHGYKQGDTFTLYMPDSPEKHVLTLAAAKSGIKISEIDSNITDIPQLREALKIANPTVIYFFPTKNDVNYAKLLRKAIPEFYHYDDSEGQQFHSKHFKNLRLFVHCGADLLFGAQSFQNLFLPDPPVSYVEAALPTLNDGAPFYTRIAKGSNGLQVTGPIALGKVLELPNFTFLNKLLAKEYIEFDC